MDTPDLFSADETDRFPVVIKQLNTLQSHVSNGMIR